MPEQITNFNQITYERNVFFKKHSLEEIDTNTEICRKKFYIEHTHGTDNFLQFNV